MDIILVPGFWLDGSSWSDVTPPLVEAGHTVYPLTLPGLESLDAAREGIGLRDHIDAVTAAVDALDGPVVLVGHSGGGGIIHGVVDARPERIARAVYVDAGPLAEGAAINDELPAIEDEIPLPVWDLFDESDLVDLDEGLRTMFRDRALPQPRRVAYDKQQLSNEHRFDVPVTVIASTFPSAQLREWMSAGHPYVAELASISDVEFVDLPTGHWPQFTRPAELGAAVLAAVDRTPQADGLAG